MVLLQRLVRRDCALSCLQLKQSAMSTSPDRYLLRYSYVDTLHSGLFLSILPSSFQEFMFVHPHYYPSFALYKNRPATTGSPVSPNWKGTVKPHNPRIVKDNQSPAPGYPIFRFCESILWRMCLRFLISFSDHAPPFFSISYITGHYNQSTSCGTQALSSKATQSSFSFGKASREEYQKSYLSKKHQVRPLLLFLVICVYWTNK
jgi:hypothetical protein